MSTQSQAPAVRSPRAPIPREHGAWAQMALPLVSALLVAGPSVAGVSLAVATVLGFISHESALVLLGARGTRVKGESGPRAKRWLSGLLAGAVVAGGTGVWLAPWPALVALALAGIGAAVTLGLAVKRLEQSMLGEFTVISAFVAAGAAVALADGGPLELALTMAVTWWLAFGASIFAVHVVLERATSKGTKEVGVRHAVLVLALAGGGSAAALRLGFGWVVPAAVAPMASVCLAVCLVRFSAKDLNRLGWGLAGASTATLVLLVMGLRFAARPWGAP